MKKLALVLLFLRPVLFAESPPYYEETGAKALAEIRYNWQALLADWEISFLPGQRGLLGMAYRDSRRIDIWVRPEQRPVQVAGIIVHELAHRIDWVVLTQQQRRVWRKLRHIPLSVPWAPPPGTSDYWYAAGDFAECMAWTIQGPGTAFNSGLNHGRPPNKAEQQVILKWLAAINTDGR